MVVLRSADIKAIAKQVAEELAGMNDSLLNISKVAEMLGKSKPAIYKMCQRGQLPHHKQNGSLFFSQRELENYFLNK
jgi:predicted DNA-binding transcriptional regulator AlpA